ncbi:hypothetical protein HMPREF9554_01799, partial [Treponema phagedenis F0421]
MLLWCWLHEWLARNSGCVLWKFSVAASAGGFYGGAIWKDIIKVQSK